MVHHNVCPLCSSEKIFLHFRCIDHFVSEGVFEVFKCLACSFEFTTGYPDEAEIGDYYESDDYISHSDTSTGFSNKIYHLARNIMMHRKRRIIENVTGLEKGRLLDIGSGTGHFAGTMKKAGWHVKGVEINEKALEFSVSKFELDIISPNGINSLVANSFDCITLWHVLEHFHDPFKYVSDIFSLLKSGGICLVALPNCASYDAVYYGSSWAAYDVPRHLWHFSPVTFRLFLEKTGFVLVDLKTLPFDVFYISVLSEKYKGSRLAFLTGLIKAFLFALYSAFRKRKSSSIIYILRKSSDQ
jgi:SAM-dependent methyltransferase